MHRWLGQRHLPERNLPPEQKAGRVDIFDNSWTASRSEKEAEWQRNASQHRVLTGMPVRWVREALGDPAEVRDTTTAGAAEVWVYNLSDRSVQVGMLDNQVVWLRETPLAVPSARVAPEPAASSAADPPPCRPLQHRQRRGPSTSCAPR